MEGFILEHKVIDDVSLQYYQKKAKTDLCIFCIPQGRRNGQFFIETFEYVLPKNVNIIVLENPGVNGAESLLEKSTVKNLANLSDKLIVELGFEKKTQFFMVNLLQAIL